MNQLFGLQHRRGGEREGDGREKQKGSRASNALYIGL